MKAAFFFLGLACLTTGLAASSFDFPQNEESDVEGFERIFHPKAAEDEQKIEELIITYPPARPSTAYPTRPPWFPSTTSRPRPTTTTTTTTTTSRPTTTSKPFPPGIRNPQIFKNILDVQAPLAGRLYNFVQNYQGDQDTRQKNEILYNLRFAKAVGRELDEE